MVIHTLCGTEVCPQHCTPLEGRGASRLHTGGSFVPSMGPGAGVCVWYLLTAGFRDELLRHLFTLKWKLRKAKGLLAQDLLSQFGLQRNINLSLSDSRASVACIRPGNQTELSQLLSCHSVPLAELRKQNLWKDKGGKGRFCYFRKHVSLGSMTVVKCLALEPITLGFSFLLWNFHATGPWGCLHTSNRLNYLTWGARIILPSYGETVGITQEHSASRYSEGLQ